MLPGVAGDHCRPQSLMTVQFLDHCSPQSLILQFVVLPYHYAHFLLSPGVCVDIMCVCTNINLLLIGECLFFHASQGNQT